MTPTVLVPWNLVPRYTVSTAHPYRRLRGWPHAYLLFCKCLAISLPNNGRPQRVYNEFEPGMAKKIWRSAAKVTFAEFCLEEVFFRCFEFETNWVKLFIYDATSNSCKIYCNDEQIPEDNRYFSHMFGGEVGVVRVWLITQSDPVWRHRTSPHHIGHIRPHVIRCLLLY